MKKKQASISLLSANFNNSKFLQDFFESIINSTIIPAEVIIIDDCSTDNSIEIIEDYQKKIDNLILIKLEKNIGFANALNKGVKLVSQEYILRIDPDDIIAPTRIEKQWNFMKQNPKTDILGSNIFYFADNISNIVGQSNFPADFENIILRYQNGYHGLIHGSILIKSNILKNINYDQTQVPAEEYDIFSRILKAGFIAENLEECLTFVRIHNNSASFNYPISTFRKIRNQQTQYWDKEISELNFRRKFFMINAYRKSLTSNLLKKYFFKAIAASLAPSLIIKRIKIK